MVSSFSESNVEPDGPPDATLEPAEEQAGAKPKPKAAKSQRKRSKKVTDPERPGEEALRARLAERSKMLDQLTKKNEALEDRQNLLEDKRLRLMAEFENYRKRTRKEWELLKQRTRAEVLVEMLSVVDDFERAFRAMGERDDDIVQGIRLIYNNMTTTLDQFGVAKMDVLDMAFDPTRHMAVGQIEREGVETNRIVEVVESGYVIEDTVIRPAKVIIAK